MTLGQKIREMRKQMGLSQETLGEIVNVSRQTITKWETDVGVPDVSNLAELAKLFGVPVDYFLSSKSNNVINQLDIDITEYRNNKENNLQIIRHFYSDEWNVNYLRYTFYPKNLFLKLGLYMGFLFSESFNKAGMAAAYIYDIDKINDNYYLLRRDNMIFIAFINKDRLVVNNISNIKIKKGNIFNRTPHFVYDNKMFSIYIFSNPNDTNNKSIF